MTLLLQSTPPPPVTRNKTGVANLIKSKAPAGQMTLEQWLAWLKEHWI